MNRLSLPSQVQLLNAFLKAKLKDSDACTQGLLARLQESFNAQYGTSPRPLWCAATKLKLIRPCESKTEREQLLSDISAAIVILITRAANSPDAPEVSVTVEIVQHTEPDEYLLTAEASCNYLQSI